jgi:penicillin-binding protein 2
MRLREARRPDKRRAVFTRRALLLMAGQAGVLGMLGTTLYDVQVRGGARYQVKARENSISTRLIAPKRGRITDRYGAVLAGNKLNWRALLVAEQTPDFEATLNAFSAVIPLDARERARIRRDVRRQRRFIPVMVRDFLSWEDMARIEVSAPDLPGIIIDAGTSRVYPTGSLCAHFIGYVAPPTEKDVQQDPSLALPGMRVGRAGLEEFRDVALRGRAGDEQVEVNAVGRVIREVAREEGQPGEDLRTTIDAGLQAAVMARLGQDSASAVVLDCLTGEVMAIASNPSFDPSLFDSGVPQAQWQAWQSDPRGPLNDKTVNGLYSPGSTFKPNVAIAALQAGAITPQTRFFCPGYFDLGKARFYCWRRGGHGNLDLHGGIKNSCDVYFYNTALKVGIDPIAAMSHRFGMGTHLGIDLPHQRVGLVPTREWRRAQGHPWVLGDTVISGIGQGFIQVTPLQLATYTARLATGRAVQPHLTVAVGDTTLPGGQPTDWPMLDIPEPFLAAARGGMWAVVNEPGGSAPEARLPNTTVQMAGKTGSAQVIRITRAQREHGFDSGTLPWKLRPNALFIAFAPYDAPRYAVAVVVEHGNAGATAAAPVARDIMVETLERDPAGRSTPKAPPANQLADQADRDRAP